MREKGWFYWVLILITACVCGYAMSVREVHAHQPQIDFSTGPYGTSVGINMPRQPVYVYPQPQIIYQQPMVAYPPPHCGWMYHDHPACSMYYRRYYERKHHGHGHHKHNKHGR
jgi:hypothetical protein